RIVFERHARTKLSVLAKLGAGVARKDRNGPQEGQKENQRHPTVTLAWGESQFSDTITQLPRKIRSKRSFPAKKRPSQPISERAHAPQLKLSHLGSVKSTCALWVN